MSFDKKTSLRPRISLVAVWVVFCAYCNFMGWVLSAAHALNVPGFGIALGLALVIFGVWKIKTGAVFFCPQDFGKFRRRFRRPLPMAFFILAVLAVLGGVLYVPTNYDAMAYRLPRVLHWLAEGRWHWIHTDFNRVNTRGPGIEWVSAPIMALTGTDRLLFLINVVSFLFLPGLIFSVFTRLGIRPRVAWCWMWPLSCGYCFLLQAGSIANDLFAAVLVLAAMDYALRSHQQKSLGALWLSILAAGLFTGVKANTVPLGLPYVIALAPGWRLWFRKIYVTVAICVVAAVVSFLPISFLNIKYAGDWTGGVSQHMASSSGTAWARFAGNVSILAINGLTPPVAPFAGWWNSHVAARLAKTSSGQKIDATFDIQNTVFTMSEMDTEETSGLGFGLCVLLFATALGVLWNFRNRARCESFRPLPVFFNLGTYIAFFVFMVSSYYLSTVRLLTPYYPLLVIPLFMIVSERLVRQRWWQVTALGTFVVAAAPLMLNPARPLFPWKPAVALMQRLGCPAKFVSRAEKVYSVYSHRHDSFAPAIALLPPETRVVGLVTYDDPEAALWQPFGSRRVIHVCHEDTGAFLRKEGITYVLVSSEKFRLDFQKPLEQWLAEIHGTLVRTFPLALRAGEGPVDWYLVRLD
ncbi:MAG TPA: hypothetical protein VN873_01235 [Candidatus Angelobacter sp.]|nr:hypothetical protein [Candidatus Angelobacter sp.]